MENFENPYLEQFQERLNQAIADAIKPFQEDNRLLRLALGMSVHTLAFKVGADFNQSLDAVFSEASILLQHLPCAILPTDLLIQAGATHSNNEMGKMLEKMESGDRQDSDMEEVLCEILHDFANEVSRWFYLRYWKLQEIKSSGDIQDELDIYSEINRHEVQVIAMRMMDEINLSVPVPEHEILKTNVEGESK